MPTNSSATLSPRTNAYAVKKFLARGQEQMVTERFGQVDPQPKNKGKVRKWRRYEPLPAPIAPLSEGVTPEADTLTVTDVEVTLQQYGGWVPITDVLADTHEDPVLNEAVALAGEQAAAVVEKVRIAALKAGTNVFYANSVAARTDIVTSLKVADLKLIERSFRRNLAKPISRIIAASPNVSTEPVGQAFFAMCHTDLEHDVRGLTGFVPIEKYSDSMKAVENEIGKVGSVRFIMTTMFEPWLTSGASSSSAFLSNGVDPASTAACDVYPIIIVARDAYGIVPLQGMVAAQVKVYQPGQASPADPLGQVGFVSWKLYQACVILNQLWIARLEAAVTAVPA